MVIDWTDHDLNRAGGELQKMRAAEYVRMSTEHQQYSTDNQSVTIRRYAESRGYEIVRTYADEGKSGLNLEGRESLRQLIDDIEKGRADFKAVLVYDVSRWGRFQDPDEAATYELRCRRAGVAVHYCAEQFENDGSIGSSIIKTVKRAMAGEYSRELSVKVFAGQANLIRHGYRQGGAAGFGLRRVLIDQNGERKAELSAGEHKSIATDRVILIPGPEDEILVVRDVYQKFVEEGLVEREIAASLNERGIKSDLGRAWTRGSIHQLLINEKYIGNNVWGRTSFKLKYEHVRNSADDWIRADGVFEAIVDRDMFDRAQAIIFARSERLSDDAMIEKLRLMFERAGKLSGIIIDEFEGPSSSAYRTRFGSLLRAYALVGFIPDHDYRYLEINRSLRRMHPTLISQVVEGLQAAGGQVTQDPTTDLLTINGEFTASIVIVRCAPTLAGSLRWRLRLDTPLNPDITVAVRMDSDNIATRDYYLLPRLDMHDAILRLCEHNGLSLDAYRFDRLAAFYQLAARAEFRRAA
ncbi:recombinase family protein [Sphingomonas sp. SRS2]|uniref:recombinase family protein n=1 Tax=Sphingomonas sp. SRS2 TaxID=133190 RepID=UPI000618487E|nr:recombinase family protein [Sphingomonas sp. SRS2]KKC24363.1 serine recombinase [Sphingomonas sp. SRS2]